MRDVLGRQEIDRHIVEWYRLSNGEVVDQSDPFFRFVAAWIAFNAFYSSRMHDEVGDWKQIRAYAGEPEIVDQHRKLLEDREYAKAVEILREKGVYDTATRTHRVISDPLNLNQVTSCLYQIRCNLFHGGKAPGNLRDLRLVTAAHTITSRLIESALVIGNEHHGGPTDYGGRKTH
jgi:hypothetical protein